jgi:sugar-specific transcriptional regulator TrmB
MLDELIQKLGLIQKKPMAIVAEDPEIQEISKLEDELDAKIAEFKKEVKLKKLEIDVKLEEVFIKRGKITGNEGIMEWEFENGVLLAHIPTEKFKAMNGLVAPIKQ